MALLPATKSELTTPYWTGGANGELLIGRCRSCEFWIHPPLPLCPECHSQDVGPQAVSGRGTVWSWTINRYQWVPELQPPYVIAQVELVEQPGLLVLTTVRALEITIGMDVRVDFERAGDDSYIPVFVS